MKEIEWKKYTSICNSVNTLPKLKFFLFDFAYPNLADKILLLLAVLFKTELC